MAMKLTVYERIIVRDSSKPADQNRVAIDPGEYILDEIENPTGASMPWLVLRGTTHGAAKLWWFEQAQADLLEIVDDPAV